MVLILIFVSSLLENKCQIAGPKGGKGNLELIEDKENAKFTVKIKPSMKGKYLLYVKIADQNISKSPFTINVR